MNKKLKKKGFTLIELVIVLAVLAIIALIAIPNFNKVRVDSQKKADDATCETIKGVTQMAIADEYFKVTATGTVTPTITIDFTNGSKVVTFGTGITVSTATQLGGTETGAVKYEAALGEVKAPQEKNKNKYVVTLDVNDSITSVVTDGATP